MSQLASEVNASLGEKVVGPDGRLKMFMFRDAFESKTKSAEDAQFVRRLKSRWAGLETDEARHQEAERLGLSPLTKKWSPEQLTDTILRAHDQEAIGRSGNLAEVAATTLLQRGLGEKFVVVRAAAYDDLKHGLDTIVVDRNTGKVICAFDEVMGSEHDERVEEKRRRQEEAIARGGVDLDYGFTFEDGQMVKQSFKNIPIFRLRLGRVEVNAVLTECDNNEGLGAQGEQSLAGLLDSLAEQATSYLANPALKPAMRTELEHYLANTLPAMRTAVEQRMAA